MHYCIFNYLLSNYWLSKASLFLEQGYHFLYSFPVKSHFFLRKTPIKYLVLEWYSKTHLRANLSLRDSLLNQTQCFNPMKSMSIYFSTFLEVTRDYPYKVSFLVVFSFSQYNHNIFWIVLQGIDTNVKESSEKKGKFSLKIPKTIMWNLLFMKKKRIYAAVIFMIKRCNYRR